MKLSLREMLVLTWAAEKKSFDVDLATTEIGRNSVLYGGVQVREAIEGLDEKGLIEVALWMPDRDTQYRVTWQGRGFLNTLAELDH